MNLQKLLLTRRFFSTLAFFSMQTVFFIYLQGKGLSNSEIAFSLSLLFFCNQALAILAGIWGDRFGLAKMMLLGCFLDVIAYIFFLSADNYILLLIATTCFGLGSCLFGTNAKACLLVLAGEEYKEKTRLQGKYLKVTSMSSMFAPLLVIPFIKYNHIESLIWVCFAMEAVLFALMVKPFYQIQTLQTLVKFRIAQIKEIITKEFLLVHLMLFIPLSIATSFFVIFPFLFDNKLGMPEHSPIALFVNGLLTVSLQSYFSRKINLTIKQTLWVAPILAVGIILPWFITLKYISVLGEICIDILRAVGLRSVGKNQEKTKAFSGVLGITFLKSSEMAEEMYASMCCRGFTGEYSIGQKYKIRVVDIFYILVTIGCVGLFFYLNRGM